MYNINSFDFASDFHAMLYDLWRFDFENRIDNCDSYYDSIREEFISKLANDVKTTISFFNSLDLNKLIDSYAMSFVDPIIERLKTPEEKKQFKEFITTLSEKYPNSPHINWGAYSFFDAINSMNDVDLNSSSSSENTTDENSEN